MPIRPFLVLSFLALLTAPALAQGSSGGTAIEFGSTAGENVLEGGRPGFAGGAGAVSGGDRDRRWRDGDYHSPIERRYPYGVYQAVPSREFERRRGIDRDRYERRYGRGYGDGLSRDYGYVDRAYDDRRANRRRSSVVTVGRPPSSGFIRGTGVFASSNPSIGGGGYRTGGSFGSGAAEFGPHAGPRIIDVEAERLDRRPVPSGGSVIQFVGGAKVIRLAADGRGRPADTPRERPLSAAGYLEPWSDAWLRDCVERYESFDARRGTFRDTDGRTQFCTGGPA